MAKPHLLHFYVKAWMQWMPLTSELESQLKIAKLKSYTAYTVNHIWQDTVTNLVQMQRTNSGLAWLLRIGLIC
ncbi:DUF928 domain-containing protein [Nostoc sp.]|uniref:DUF928 domain-containing protein n=1 Tax=Nostoc sp. TaxID=1180 RepID=UPI003FA54EB8